MQRKKLLIIVIVLMSLAVILAWLSASTFHIVKTDPKLSSISSNDGHIDVSFNKPLAEKDLRVSISPDNIYRVEIRNSKTLRIIWGSPLSAGNKYLITLHSIYSANGQIIRDKKLKFTAVYKSFEGLSAAEQRSIVNSQDNNTPSDKIYQLLPHYDPFYRLDVKPNGSNKPDIVFTYLAPPPDYGSSAPDEQKAFMDAKQWLIGKGVPVTQYRFFNGHNGSLID